MVVDLLIIRFELSILLNNYSYKYYFVFAIIDKMCYENLIYSRKDLYKDN
jgi:hypothetical protein